MIYFDKNRQKETQHGELSLSVESLFGLHSRIMQLTYLKTHLTASPVDFQNRLCYTMIREKKR